MSSSEHIDNKGKDILLLGKGPTQGLNNTTLAAETQYSINFAGPGIKFYLSMHYNGSNSFLFVNGTKIYQFKAKDSEIKTYLMSLGNILGDFSTNNMKKTGLKGVCTIFLLVIELLILVILSISINF